MRVDVTSDAPPAMLACQPALMLSPRTSQNGAPFPPDTCRRADVDVDDTRRAVGVAGAPTPLPLRVPGAGVTLPLSSSGSAAPPAAESKTRRFRFKPVVLPHLVSTSWVP